MATLGDRFDGLRIVDEAQHSTPSSGPDQLLARNYFGVQLDEIIATKRDVSVTFVPLYPITDLRGSSERILDSNGNVLESYRFTPYGQRIIEGCGTTCTVSDYGYDFGFTGYRVEKFIAIGKQLAFARYREYDPAYGRFLEQDPLGFRGGGANFYEYAGGQPISVTDPLGLYASVSRPGFGIPAGAAAAIGMANKIAASLMAGVAVSGTVTPSDGPGAFDSQTGFAAGFVSAFHGKITEQPYYPLAGLPEEPKVTAEEPETERIPTEAGASERAFMERWDFILRMVFADDFKGNKRKWTSGHVDRAVNQANEKFKRPKLPTRAIKPGDVPSEGMVGAVADWLAAKCFPRALGLRYFRPLGSSRLESFSFIPVVVVPARN